MHLGICQPLVPTRAITFAKSLDRTNSNKHENISKEIEMQPTWGQMTRKLINLFWIIEQQIFSLYFSSTEHNSWDDEEYNGRYR